MFNVMQMDPNYRPSLMKAGIPPFAGSDLVLSPMQWSSYVVGKCTAYKGQVISVSVLVRVGAWCFFFKNVSNDYLIYG